MLLDEDAGVLLVGLAEVFTGGYGLVDEVVEVVGGGDAGAVGAYPAESWPEDWPLPEPIAGL